MSGAAPSARPERRAALAAFGGALMLAAAMGIGRFAYTPLLPAMQHTLDWSLAQGGDIASANYLGYLAGALAAALVAARPGRRYWLFCAMVGCASTTAAGAFAVSFAAWAILRLLAGLASAFCLVIGTAVVMEQLQRAGQARMWWLHFAGVGLGVVISEVVIEAARAAGTGMFTQWGVLGVVAALLLLGGWFAMAPSPVPVAGGRPASVPFAPRARAREAADPRLKRVIVAYGLYGFGYVITATFIVVMARRISGGGALEPLTWTVVGTLAAPSIWAWQRASERFGVCAALRVAFAVEALGVALAGIATGRTAVLVGGALLGVTFVGIAALGLVAGRQLAGRRADQSLGWLTASFGLGQWLGPAVAGRLAESTGSFVAPSLLAAGMLALGVVLMWGIDTREP